MKKGSVEIVMLIDRSGSMTPLQADTIGGINSFIDEQAKESGDRRLSLYFFSDGGGYSPPNSSLTFYGSYQPNTVQTKVFRTNVKEVKKLVDEDYKPMGGTPLFDSLCKVIDDTGVILNALPDEEKPEKVIFVIITDGEENTSRRFTIDDVKQRISHQESKYNWGFMYLGANQDSFKNASSYGIQNTAYSSNWVADSKGTRALYSKTSMSINSFVADTGTAKS